MLHVRLYWSVMDGANGPPSDWSISVRPLQGEGVIAGADGLPIQQDSPGPVHGLRPFSSFAADEVVADAYRLPVDPQEVDALLVIVYRTTDEGFENLTEVRIPVR